MPNPYQQEPIEESNSSAENKSSPDEKKEISKEIPESTIQKEIPSVPEKIEKEAPGEFSSVEKDSSYGKILSKVKNPPNSQSNDEEVKMDAQNASQQNDAESQVQHLVDVAMNKGVVHAVKAAKHLEDNYVLDMFHDKLLADELHDALLKKGLIKQV